MFKLAGNGIGFFQGIQGEEYLSIFFPQPLRYFRTSQTFLPCADVAGLCPVSNIYSTDGPASLTQGDLQMNCRRTFIYPHRS